MRPTRPTLKTQRQLQSAEERGHAVSAGEASVGLPAALMSVCQLDHSALEELARIMVGFDYSSYLNIHPKNDHIKH